jgi:hypothetical protein
MTADAEQKVQPARPNPRRSGRRRALIWTVVGVVVVWIVVAGVFLLLGLLDASHGESDVALAEANLSPGDLVAQAPLGALSSAHQNFEASSSRLNSPVLAPLEVLPVIGRQLRSAQDLSSSAERVTSIGVSAVRQVGVILKTPHPAGPARVNTIDNLVGLAHETYRSLNDVNLGPSNALLSPLADKRASFVSKLDKVRTDLSHASQVGGALATILKGPQSYVLLMANNGEMRSGSGTFLELGLLSSQNGEIQLSDMTPSSSLALSPGAVPVGGDLEDRWGWLMPGVDWRNLGFTPQFDVNGALAARMWTAATGQQVDGVMAVDVLAFQDMLEVTGPVTLPGGQVVDSGNVVALLTHDQYAGLSDEPNTAAQETRQDELGSVAHGVLDAFDDESLNLKALADAMTSSTQGRHILVWSSSASQQSAWQNGGVAGTLSPDSMMVSVINRGGNKLDQYLSVGVGVRLHRTASQTSATLTIHLTNNTPSGQSQYIAGPYPGLGTSYGQYVGIACINLPSGSNHIVVTGNPPLLAEGPEGPTWLVGVPIDVLQGGSESVVLSFTLPTAHGRATVVPSARLTPVNWTFNGTSHPDSTPFVVTW